MAELLEYLAKQLVDDPESVRVERIDEEDAVVLRLFVAQDDLGKVIGRQGRIARALRTIVRAGGTRDRRRVQLEIVGRYNPQHDPSLIEFDEDKVKDWLGKGALPSEAVQKLLKAKNLA